MNRPLLLLFCLAGFLLNAQTPITYNIADVPTAGQSQRIAIDTFPLPSVNFGNKGANQVYDFSNLTLFKYDTVEYRTPTNGQLTTCPSSDVATTADGVNFLLTNTDNANNKLTLEGFEGQLVPGTTLSAAYGTKPDLFRFPTNYQTNFGGTAYLYKRVTGAQVNQPLADSVELTINTTYTDTIDGWGKVITPVGSYKCLRKQRKETTTTLIRAKTFFGWSTISNTTNTTIRYSYVTKEAKGSVINFNYDTANVLQSVNWSMIPPTAPVADFSFANASNGLVNFTDLSDGYPTSWAWTFGDGGTSTSQNPNHTYTANGTYTACLIASNAGGSSTQVCKQVVVSNVPVAPVADFSWANPSGGLANFFDLSSNTPTSWSWTFGDGGTSTQQNPNHIYTANGTYTVCLIASNTGGSSAQDCKSVIISGIGSGNSAPVAVDDTFSVTQATSIVKLVAGNDLDPNGDSICIVSVWGTPSAIINPGAPCSDIFYLSDTCFTGDQIFYYSICDNGSPALCDTAMVTVTVSLNTANYTDAFFDINDLVHDCSTMSVPNSSTNFQFSLWTIVDFTNGDSSSYNTSSLSSAPFDNLDFFGEICLTTTGKCNTSKFCSITSILCTGIANQSDGQIGLYPNPAQTELFVDLHELQSELKYIEITNLMGQIIFKQSTDSANITRIDVSTLPQGTYYVFVKGNSKEVYSAGTFVISR
jgi:PKD repeat protein